MEEFRLESGRKLQMGETVVLRDQEMTLGNGTYHERKTTVTKGKKCLTFKEDDKFGQKFAFEKCSNGAANLELEIRLSWDEVVSKTCNLGHQHDTSTGTQTKRFTLDKHHVESLVGWLQTNEWVINTRKQKEPTHVKYLKEALEMLQKIEITEASRSERSKMNSLKARIKAHLGSSGWIDKSQTAEEK